MKKQFNARLPEEIIKRIKELAELNGLAEGQMVELAIRTYQEAHRYAIEAVEAARPKPTLDAVADVEKSKIAFEQRQATRAPLLKPFQRGKTR